MFRVKICGMRTQEDVLTAASRGADALGLVFAPGPRQISLTRAKEIAAEVPPFVTLVGVFVDEPAALVNAIKEEVGLDVIQLHGQESPDYCSQIKGNVIKAIRVTDNYLEEIKAYKGRVQGFLLDTYVPGVAGGTGKTFDWTLARGLEEYGPIILAGGLTPENVGTALEVARPYGVDVSSGVESEGRKDPLRVKKFIDEVRAYDYAGNA